MSTTKVALAAFLAATAITATFDSAKAASPEAVEPMVSKEGEATAVRPLNDDIENAQSVPARPFMWAQATRGATLQVGEPVPCGYIGSTVWFKYTPSTSGYLSLDSFGSDYDTVLAAYTGSVFSLTNVACNDDDAVFGLSSRIALAVRAGETYYIQAGGYNGAQGELVLRFNLDAGDAF